MAAPVIDPRTSLQVLKVGEAFTFQLAAFDEPTSWTALHLPPGITINATTGLISGTPTVPGYYQIAVRATNNEGSDQIFILMPVLDDEIDEEHMGEWNDLVIDFDLTGRKVALHSGGGGENGLFPVGKGDAMDVLVGFYRDGVLCDVNPNDEEMSIKMALKEFEPEVLLTLVGGAPEKVVVGNSVRYRIKCYIDPDVWGPVLSSYEEDVRTIVLATSEIELKVGVSMYAQNKSTAPFTLKGNMTGDYGDNPEVSKTLVFDGLVAEDEQSYLLTLTLAVTGRPLQSAQLQRTMKIEKMGGSWSVSDVSGSDTIQGAEEGDNWRVTMKNTDIEGHSDSVDVDVEFSSTEGAMLYAFDFSVLPFKPPYMEFDLRNPNASLEWDTPWNLAVASADNDSSFITHSGSGSFSPVQPASMEGMTTVALLFEGIMHAYCDSRTLGDNDEEFVKVEAIGQYDVRLWIKSTSPARNMFFTNLSQPQDWAPFWPGSFPSAVPGDGAPASAVLSGLLMQTTGTQPARYTGQFQVEVMRDMVPDQ